MNPYALKLTLMYFSGYKTECFSFQNNPKNLDLSYKMDLDLWDSLGRVKLVLWEIFKGLILSFVVILDRGRPCLIAR